MPGSGPKYYNCIVCIVCNKRTKPKERRIIDKAVGKYLLKSLFITSTHKDVICNKCKHKYYIAEAKVQRVDEPRVIRNDPNYVPEATVRTLPCRSPPSVNLKIPSTPKTHSRCVVCKKPEPKLIVLSAEERFNAFLENNVLVASGTRCCPVHLQDGVLKPDCLKDVKISDESFMNRSSILDLLQQLRSVCLQKKGTIDFDNITDPDCAALTGLSREQFEDLFHHLADKIKSTPSRSPITSVGLFLLKLKTGLSNKLLSTIFRIGKSSIRRAIITVRQAMLRGFVPLYLGLESVTRDKLITEHTRPLAQSLFQAGAEYLILVIDGTYIYIQKSNNFQFQRRTYSLHKGRPLVKPIVIVTTTGYYVSIIGPYLADSKNNDAAILNHILQTNIADIKSFLKPDDIIVVDRGFRDSIALLEDMGLRVEMPAFMQRGEKHMSTDDANISRLVTKIVWVVESANARIKRWKYLDHVLPTNQIPFIGDYVRCICAISNKYLSPLSSSNNKEDDLVLGNKMRQLASQVNDLKTYIEVNNVERKTVIWQQVSESAIDNFPRLNEDQLRSLTCGVYQLKLSSSYIQEHLDGGSEIFFHKENPSLIRVKLQSRHVSSKKYLLWIKFSGHEVLGWYCKCRAGARVVGVCSHIASII